LQQLWLTAAILLRDILLIEAFPTTPFSRITIWELFQSVNLNTLLQFSEIGFEAIAPEEFTEAAGFCHQNAQLAGDVRFLVLEDCFRISHRFWTEGESGAAIGRDAALLLDLWKRYLPSILNDNDTLSAVSLASLLRDDIRSALADGRPT
jgi:hypothetical protein